MFVVLVFVNSCFGFLIGIGDKGLEIPTLWAGFQRSKMGPYSNIVKTKKDHSDEMG